MLSSANSSRGLSHRLFFPFRAISLSSRKWGISFGIHWRHFFGNFVWSFRDMFFSCANTFFPWRENIVSRGNLWPRSFRLVYVENERHPRVKENSVALHSVALRALIMAGLRCPIRPRRGFVNSLQFRDIFYDALQRLFKMTRRWVLLKIHTWGSWK